MAILTKSDRLHFQAEWLDIWRSAGMPKLVWHDPDFGEMSAFYILTNGETDDHSRGWPMSIWLGFRNLTSVFCKLTGRRLDMHAMTLINAKGGREMYGASFRRLAFDVHKAAAIAHHDIDAIHACGPDAFAEAEGEWLTLEMSMKPDTRAADRNGI